MNKKLAVILAASLMIVSVPFAFSSQPFFGGQGSVTSLVPGTGASNAGKAEDAVHASGDVGQAQLILRRDTPTATGADGDYVLPLSDSTGAQYVNANQVSPGYAAANLGKREDDAHTSLDVGVLSLGVYQSTPAQTAGTTGDYAPQTLNAQGATYTQILPSTANGLDVVKSLDADETPDQVKATAGMLYGLDIRNDTAATKEYVKIWNAPCASVVVGTTTPVMVIPTSGVTNYIFSWPLGIAFSSGICIGATTGIADSDTGAPAANAITFNALYK